jgi:hypothetical protein
MNPPGQSDFHQRAQEQAQEFHRQAAERSQQFHKHTRQVEEQFAETWQRMRDRQHQQWLQSQKGDHGAESQRPQRLTPEQVQLVRHYLSTRSHRFSPKPGQRTLRAYQSPLSTAAPQPKTPAGTKEDLGGCVQALGVILALAFFGTLAYGVLQLLI